MEKILFIKDDKKYIRINYEEIIYIESVKNYVRIKTNKKIFVLCKKLKQVENILCTKQFCKIHRSYIVSLNHITSFDCGFIYLENKTKLPISRQYKANLEERVCILSNDVKTKSDILEINIGDDQKN